MLHQHVELLEDSLVQQDREPLAGGELPLLVLVVDALLSAAEEGLLAQGAEVIAGFSTHTVSGMK